MSAPNFYKKNASKYFVIEDRGQFYSLDSIVDYLMPDLSKARYTLSDGTTNDRNYPGIYVAEKVLTFWDCWTLTVNVILRSGYYAHDNLDWEIFVERDSYNNYGVGDHEDFDLPRTIQNAVNNEVERLEKIFAKLSTVYTLKGIFSNGEAIYDPAD